jgi:hypothetical protein
MIVFERIMPQISTAVLAHIRNERDGNLMDSELLKNILEIYQHLSREKIAGAS